MESLRGQFLVAMPDMGDDRFRETVIYLVGHGDEGAMGLVINQSLEDMKFADKLILLPDEVRNRKVLRGGPVQKSRGFVLHSSDYFRVGNSYEVTDDICLTATLDILKAIAFKNSPSDALFALGYCGWSPGQLETEIQGNGWLTVPFSRELLFGLPIENRYDAALASLGITRATLSATAGHG
jgi:putative transcriptional regulator